MLQRYDGSCVVGHIQQSSVLCACTAVITQTVPREVQCTKIKQNKNKSHSWIVLLLKLNCLWCKLWVCGVYSFKR